MNMSSFAHQLCCFFYVLSMFIISDCTRVCLYTTVIHTDDAIICMHPYFLLAATYAVCIDWVYFTCDMHLCGYYVITDILMSVFMSLYYHNILLLLILKNVASV